jgi:hypothetical protein
MTTEPTIEQSMNGGNENKPCTLIRMYGKECKVSGSGNRWIVEAPFAFET